jgi:hypothetical protein
MTLKRLDPLYVVALAVAALLILFPPWFKRGGEREFLGFYPVFSPPRYLAISSDAIPPGFLRDLYKEDPKLLGTLNDLRYPKGRLGYGALAAELLALGVVTFTALTLRRHRQPQ